MAYRTETNFEWMTYLMTKFYGLNKVEYVSRHLIAKRDLAARGEGPRQFLEELGTQLTEFEDEVYTVQINRYLDVARTFAESYGFLDEDTQFVLDEVRKFAERVGRDISDEILEIERRGE